MKFNILKVRIAIFLIFSVKIIFGENEFYPLNNDTLLCNSLYFRIPDKFGIEKFNVRWRSINLSTNWNNISNSTPSLFAKNLPWNQTIEWEYNYSGNIPSTSWQNGGSFFIKGSGFIDTNSNCLNKKSYTPLPFYIAFESFGIITDGNLNPVLHLPDFKPGSLNPMGRIRDLEIMKNGDVIFLSDDIFGIADKNGNIKWKIPKLADTTSKYHHEIQVLDDNHKLVLASFKDSITIRTAKDTNLFSSSDRFKRSLEGWKGHFENDKILEFDERDSLIWSISLKDFIKEDEFELEVKDNGLPEIKPHANGFFYDAKTDRIYISVRNMCKLFVIRKKDKKVIQILSQRKKGDQKDYELKYQHGPFLSSDGELFVFNNRNHDQLGNDTFERSEILIFNTKTDSLELVWKMSIPGPIEQSAVNRMGYVESVGTGQLAVCLGFTNRIVFLDRINKKLIGDLETYSKSYKKGIGNYRTHIFKSLYPLYFDFHLKKNENGVVQLVIQNFGIENQTFKIEGTDENGVPITFPSQKVKQQSIGDFQLLHNGKKIKELKITSNSFKDYKFVRTY